MDSPTTAEEKNSFDRNPRNVNAFESWQSLRLRSAVQRFRRRQNQRHGQRGQQR